MVDKKQNKVDLKVFFLSLQNEMLAKLHSAQQIEHAPTKGTATEINWIHFLNEYLPKRYNANQAFIIDSYGYISQQIDCVIYDTQYSPFLFKTGDALFIPAESVYAVFEIKQNLNKNHVEYAASKIESVRKLKRTSDTIIHAGGKFLPVKPKRIIGGILTSNSDWNPPLGSPLTNEIKRLRKDSQIDIGCSLADGSFICKYNKKLEIDRSGKETALLFFFLNLFTLLQKIGTVPAMKISEYSKSL